jgi:hypothetical protein
MADNTTTYKAVIETEVTGQKAVDDLNKSIDDGGEKFLSLRRQIRETTVSLQEMADKGQETSKEFRQMSEHLKELQIQQKKVAFEAKNATDQLAALPGPLGNIGKSFAEAKDMVDVFGKGVIIATGGLVLIIGAIVAMKDAMSKTEEGNEALNKVMDALGKITAPLFALFEKVGIPLFLKFADVVEWVGGKVNKFVEWLGVSKGKVNEIATEGNKAFYDAAQKDLENMAVVQGILKKQDDEAKAKAKAANEKYLKDKEDREKEALEVEKRLLAKSLEEYEKHLKARKKLDDSFIGADSLKNKTAAAKKVEDEEIKRAKETAETIRLLKINSEDKQLAWSKTHQTTALADEITAKQKAATKEVTIIDWLNSEKKKKLDENLMAVKAGLNIAGNLVDQGSDAAKAIAVAQTGIDTYQSATAAYKATVGIPVVGPVLAPIAAAAAIAAGLMSVNKILSTQVPKMGDGSTGGASAGGSTPNIEAPTIPTMQFNDSSLNLGGNNPTTQIANTLAQTTKQPIKAYVVSTDMSSQQALDRRTNVAATF